ncbi:MAG: glycosyltransferase [Planctomycetaceae bacterium]|nr:glycosyltransferase [Planctomycetaceae bacterium]
MTEFDRQISDSETSGEHNFPLVSVIIPAYNSEKFVAETIQSVISQTYANWECIVVNDGSTDNTAEVVKPFLQDDRIRLVHKENGGLSSARNAGMEKATGELFAFLDADDIWLPEKLEKSIAFFNQHPEAGVCGTNKQNFNSQGIIPNSAETGGVYSSDATVAIFTAELSIPASSIMIRRRVWDTIGGFDEHYRYAEDYDFLLRASAEFPICKLNDVLLNYRVGEKTSLSYLYGDKRRDLVMYTIIPKFRRLYPGKVKWYHVMQLCADIYRNRADRKTKFTEKTYWLLRSLLCNPFRLEVYYLLVRQFLPQGLIQTLKRLRG